jgi:proton-coupled amino acid transporter
MILPVENKLETPEDFLDNFGVLPTTMMLCTIFMTALGFYGYNGFGDKVAPTITTNVPLTGLYSVVNVFLMLQSMLGHSIAMYVVFDMFFNGFRRKFQARYPTVPKQVADKGFRCFWVLITYLMAVLIPKLEIMIPLVGVTSGTLCALVYPPLFHMITFWSDWKTTLTPAKRAFKIALNSCVIFIGLCAISAGIYTNVFEILLSFGIITQ